MPDDCGTEFRLLGTLEAIHHGAVREIAHGRQQALLAALLLRPNQTVPAAALVESVWGKADRSALNVCVMRLRRSLHDNDHKLIRSEADGYRIAVDTNSVDLHRFRHLCMQAREAGNIADRQRERTILRQALALWRGDVLAGIDSPMLRTETIVLFEEERLTAIEHRIHADLECGAHAEVIGELRKLVAAHPFRERFWCQLLLALYRCERQYDALDAFLRARRTLTRELGVEPGTELRELHHRILTADPTLRLPDNGPTRIPRLNPAQLPADTADFAGRHGQLRQFDDMLERPDTASTTLIVGPAGIGKTALAVHWASRNRPAWPDGQLYLDLRGFPSQTPVNPIAALAYFLRSLGVPADHVPTELDEAAALYRSVLADRRMLILLDNAASAAQVHPLLPGGHEHTVIVTSRDQLTDVIVRQGARRLLLDTFTDFEARAVLSRTVGPERIAAEPHAVTELIELCRNLPLALQVATADLNGLRERRLSDHLAQLRSGIRTGR